MNNLSAILERAEEKNNKMSLKERNNQIPLNVGKLFKEIRKKYNFSKEEIGKILNLNLDVIESIERESLEFCNSVAKKIYKNTKSNLCVFKLFLKYYNNLKIGNDLKILRINSKLSQSQMAKILKVSVNTISSIEKGSRGERGASIKKLANFFNYRLEYKTNLPDEYFEDKKLNSDIKLGIYLKERRVAEGLSLNDLSIILGLSSRTIYNVEHGNVNKETNSVKKIKDFFYCDTGKIDFTFSSEVEDDILEKMELKKIGYEIKKRRIIKGFTQADVGKSVGITAHSVYRIESGAVSRQSDSIEKVSKFLNYQLPKRQLSKNLSLGCSIKFKRKERRIEIRKMEKELNISRSVISKIENDEFVLNKKAILTICNFLNIDISEDYLNFYRNKQLNLNVNMSAGEKLKNARLEKGYSQKEVAKKIGVSRPYIAKMENDKINNVYKNPTFLKLCDLYNLTVTNFEDEEIKELALLDSEYIDKFYIIIVKEKTSFGDISKRIGISTAILKKLSIKEIKITEINKIINYIEEISKDKSYLKWENPLTEIGELIKFNRLIKGLSRLELAEKTSSPWYAIKSLEENNYCKSERVLQKILDFLEITNN